MTMFLREWPARNRTTSTPCTDKRCGRILRTGRCMQYGIHCVSCLPYAFWVPFSKFMSSKSRTAQYIFLFCKDCAIGSGNLQQLPQIWASCLARRHLRGRRRGWGRWAWRRRRRSSFTSLGPRKKGTSKTKQENLCMTNFSHLEQLCRRHDNTMSASPHAELQKNCWFIALWRFDFLPSSQSVGKLWLLGWKRLSQLNWFQAARSHWIMLASS